MKNKIKSVMKWVLFNGLLASAVYFGFFKHVEGALSIAYFIAWVFIALSLTRTMKSTQALMRKNGRSVPRWMNTFVDLTITLVFVWHSAWITGVFYLLHLSLNEACWLNALKETDDKKGTDANV